MHSFSVFALAENNNEVLELYKKLCSQIKKQSKAINSGGSIKYTNAFMKIIIDSYDDDLPSAKILSYSVLDIVVISVFQT